MPDYGLGLVPSPPDARDYQIADHIDMATPLPAKWMVWGDGSVPPVMDQGATPKCVAYSNCGEANFIEWQDESRWHSFDPDWLYAECKKRDGFAGDGTSIRVALSIRKNIGLRTKGHSDEAQHKVKAYYAVPYSDGGLAIKQAMYQTKGPILIGTRWYKSWFKPKANGLLPAPDSYIGGHATYLWGWDDTRKVFYGRNSWGRDYGSYGNYLMPYQYVSGAHFHDAWRVTDILEGPTVHKGGYAVPATNGPVAS